MTSWTVARQAPLSVGFPRQEYWSGLPFPSPGDLPDPGIEPRSPALWADSLPFEPPGKLACMYIIRDRVRNWLTIIETEKSRPRRASSQISQVKGKNSFSLSLVPLRSSMD